MRFALLDVYQTAAVDCWSDITYYTPFYLTTVLTLSFLACSAVLHRAIPGLIARCCPQYDSSNSYWRSVCLKITVVVMTVMYPALSLKSLALWNCTRVGDTLYLVEDLSIECEGEVYWRASFFNMVFVLLVVFGWPLFIVWYLRRMKTLGKLDEERVRDRVGFLYEQFDTKHLYWEVGDTVRKLYLVTGTRARVRVRVRLRLRLHVCLSIGEILH